MAAALGLIAAALLLQLVSAQKSPSQNLEPIFPKRLKIGDTIGIGAPGYSVNPDVLDDAKRALRFMGFKPYHTERIIGNHGYFSNTFQKGP